MVAVGAGAAKELEARRAKRNEKAGVIMLEMDAVDEDLEGLMCDLPYL